jgi:hypothetical protein
MKLKANKPYLLIPCTNQPGKAGNFAFTVFWDKYCVQDGKTSPAFKPEDVKVELEEIGKEWDQVVSRKHEWSAEKKTSGGKKKKKFLFSFCQLFFKMKVLLIITLRFMHKTLSF